LLLARFGLELARRRQFFLGVFTPAGFEQRLAELVVHAGAIGLKVHGLLQVPDGVETSAFPQVSFAEPGERERKLWVERQGAAKHPNGGGRVALVEVNRPAVLVTPGLLGRNLHLGVKFLPCRVEHPQPLVDHAEVEMGVRELRVARHGLFQLFAGLLVFVKVEVSFAEQQVEVRRVAAGADELLEGAALVVPPCGMLVVMPSPKSQNRLVIVPLDWSLKETVSGTTPLVGLPLNKAMGGSAPMPDRKLVAGPPLPLMKTTTLLKLAGLVGLKVTTT